MGMQYRSTMGKDPPVDMRTMVFKGKPDDGGLYMPVGWYGFSITQMFQLGGKNLQEIGYEVGRKFFGKDIPDQALQDIAQKALTFDIPIVQCGSDNVYIMRLDQGPTGAFKDFAAQYMAQVMSYYTKDLDREMTIIVATSGDTGSAVAKAFHKVPGIKVYVMYPKHGITPTQAALMDTLGENVYARSVEAKFDLLQTWAQMLMDDPDLKSIEKNTANSIHLLRLLPQTIYHLYGSSRVREGDPEYKIIKSDASGNFGNMTADVIAKKYLRNWVEKIIVATNENDEFPVFMATDSYKPLDPSRDCLSKSMNVGNPSNLRRLFYIYGGCIDKAGNVLKMPDLGEMRKELFAISISDGLTRERIKNTWKDHRIAVEPHGAVALEAAYRYRDVAGEKSRPILVTETAAPWKFSGDLKNLDVDFETPEWVKEMEKAPRFNEDLPGKYEAIKEDFRGI